MALEATRLSTHPSYAGITPEGYVRMDVDGFRHFLTFLSSSLGMPDRAEMMRLLQKHPLPRHGTILFRPVDPTAEGDGKIQQLTASIFEALGGTAQAETPTDHNQPNAITPQSTNRARMAAKAVIAPVSPISTVHSTGSNLEASQHEADQNANQVAPSLPQRAPERGSLQPIDAPIAPSTISEGIGPKLRAVLQEPYQWVEIPEELQRAIDGHRASLRKQGFQDARPDNVLAQEIALKRGLAKFRRIHRTNMKDEEIIPLLDKKYTDRYGMPEWLRLRVQEYQRKHLGDNRTTEAIARQFAREEMTGISPEMKPLVRERMQSHPEISPFEIAQALNLPREHILVSQAEFTQMLEAVIADQATAIANGGRGILPPTMAKLIPQARALMQRLAANHPTYQIRYSWPQTSSREEQIANIFEVIRRFGPTFQGPEREEPVITGEPFYRDEFGEFRRLLDSKRLPTRWVPIQQGSMPRQPQMEVEIKPANPPTRPHIEDTAADSMELPPRPQLQFWPRNIPAALEGMYAGFKTFRSFTEDAKTHGKVHRHASQGGISTIDIDNDTHRVRIDLDTRSNKVVAVRYGPISATSEEQIENISQILGNIRPLDGLLVHQAELLSDLYRQHPEDENLRVTRNNLKTILEDLDQREQALLANRIPQTV